MQLAASEESFCAYGEVMMIKISKSAYLSGLAIIMMAVLFSIANPVLAASSVPVGKSRVHGPLRIHPT